jgi:hypothetical protein
MTALVLAVWAMLLLLPTAAAPAVIGTGTSSVLLPGLPGGSLSGSSLPGSGSGSGGSGSGSGSGSSGSPGSSGSSLLPGGSLPGSLRVVWTANASKGSPDHDGLQYVAQARAYASSPADLVTTMRGGGVAVWRWANSAGPPSLSVRALALRGISTEGQDSLGSLLVVVALNRGIFTFDWPSMRPRGNVTLSSSGALHCKLYIDKPSGRTFALVTTGLTHVDADRNKVVAVDVTNRDEPVEVATLVTPVKATEGILVLGSFAYVGGYVSPNSFISLNLSGLGTHKKMQITSVAGPMPQYDNMVGALRNSSFRQQGRNGFEAQEEQQPLMFFGSYARPGGLVIFQSQKNGSLSPGPVGQLLSIATARTNRVHMHPSGNLALLALEKGALCADCETGGELVTCMRGAQRSGSGIDNVVASFDRLTDELTN